MGEIRGAVAVQSLLTSRPGVGHTIMVGHCYPFAGALPLDPAGGCVPRSPLFAGRVGLFAIIIIYIILRGIISIAKALQMKTIAEGVETKEQYELLRDFGVDYIQGYYFAKPMSEVEVIEKYFT